MADLARERRVDVPEDHPAFDGHFPGRPLLPGVALLAHAQEVLLADADLAPWLAHGVGVKAAKFLAPVGPGATLTVRWTAVADARRVQVEVWRFAAGDAGAGVLACTAQFEVPAP